MVINVGRISYIFCFLAIYVTSIKKLIIFWIFMLVWALHIIKNRANIILKTWIVWITNLSKPVLKSWNSKLVKNWTGQEQDCWNQFGNPGIPNWSKTELIRNRKSWNSKLVKNWTSQEQDWLKPVRKSWNSKLVENWICLLNNWSISVRKSWNSKLVKNWTGQKLDWLKPVRMSWNSKLVVNWTSRIINWSKSVRRSWIPNWA